MAGGRDGSTSYPSHPSRSLSLIIFVLRALHADFAAELGLDEGVDVAVHGGLDVVGFLAGAEVQDLLVGLENVGTDLVAPGDVALLTVGALGLGAALVFLELEELCLEDLEGEFLVRALRAGIGGADQDAG